jgi:hypothetical protein
LNEKTSERLHKELEIIRKVKPFLNRKVVNNVNLFVCKWNECRFKSKVLEEISSHIQLKHLDRNSKIIDKKKVVKRFNLLVKEVSLKSSHLAVVLMMNTILKRRSSFNLMALTAFKLKKRFGNHLKSSKTVPKVF